MERQKKIRLVAALSLTVLAMPSAAQDLFGSDDPAAAIPLQNSMAPYAGFAMEYDRMAAGQVGLDWRPRNQDYQFLSNTSPAEMDDRWQQLLADPDFEEFWQDDRLQAALDQLHAGAMETNSPLALMTPDEFKTTFAVIRSANSERDWVDEIRRWDDRADAQLCIIFITCGPRPWRFQQSEDLMALEPFVTQGQ